MFRTLKFGTAAALVGTTCLLTSCLEAPDYPTTPQITFKDVKVERFVDFPGSVPIDSTRITVDFVDGDGDLGLDINGDKEAPYNPENPDGTYNRTTHNYFITAYRRSSPTAEFRPYVPNAKGGYNSRFPPLYSADGKAGPIKGSLTLTLGLGLGSPFLPGEEVRFEVSIMDRALHESNKVTTSSFIVQPL